MIESYALTENGCVRTQNEDRVLTDHSLSMFVVADGMGGHSHGERAAELAIAALQHYIDASQDRFDVTWPFGYNFNFSMEANRLNTGIQLANRQVWNRGQTEPDCTGMGTTLAAVLLGDGRAVVGNVGDSRVYLFRGNELKQISYDDTLLNSASQQAGVDEIDLANNPMRNVLTQAAGSREDTDVHIVEQQLESGDLYLICSDGLHGVIGDSAIRSLLGTSETLERTALRLKDAALAKGGPDNISVILLSYNS